MRLHTKRLILRSWLSEDLEPFAEMNADGEVMRYFPAKLTSEESDALGRRIQADIDRQGWGLWAIEEQATKCFLGFTGLAKPNFDAHFTPCVEIGWRLMRQAWGKGFATEAARAAADFAFIEVEVDELVSFTVPNNLRSRAVMERLGMTHNSKDDFDRSDMPEGDPLARHVLYRLKRE
jgi:RimJ/RimL family protein N-acetyltransferase